MESLSDAVVIDAQLPAADRKLFEQGMPVLQNRQALCLLVLTGALARPDQQVSGLSFTGTIYKPIRPRQLLQSLSQSFAPSKEVQVQSPVTLVFDPQFASRLPLRILLADDNPINQKVGQRYLERLGYRIKLVSNGLEAMTAVENEKFDIVFLDAQMPEMDGYETARQIRLRWDENTRPALIAMTASAMQGDREKCLEAGMDDYLAKPVRAEDLCATLERWGRRRGTLPSQGGPTHHGEFFMMLDVTRTVPFHVLDGIPAIHRMVGRPHWSAAVPQRSFLPAANPWRNASSPVRYRGDGCLALHKLH